jgi:hypothetical protein
MSRKQAGYTSTLAVNEGIPFGLRERRRRERIQRPHEFTQLIVSPPRYSVK